MLYHTADWYFNYSALDFREWVSHNFQNQYVNEHRRAEFVRNLVNLEKYNSRDMNTPNIRYILKMSEPKLL